jgi:hypothetical protein
MINVSEAAFLRLRVIRDIIATWMSVGVSEIKVGEEIFWLAVMLNE